MHILVAPDKFKGTLTARQVCDAVTSGWSGVRPHDTVEAVPMADGGEGTMQALADALGGRLASASVTGPLGHRVDADFALVPVDGGLLGVVELARASGLGLVPSSQRDPNRTTTRGTGELMLAAMEAGARRLLVCIGGSATNDGGVGMAQAMGYRFLDAGGNEIGPGGKGLLDLMRIDATHAAPQLSAVSVVGACDVDNPLTGPHGASATYGPQKGASADDVLVLDRALGHLAAVVERDLGIPYRDAPGAGAAGGVGFGLLAFCGARLRPGVEVVMEAVDLVRRIAQADLVLTGEGSLDAQSLHGKTPAGVLDACALARVPAVVVCGRAEISLEAVEVVSLVERVGADAALGDTRASLRLVAEELAARADAMVARR
ncbi:MAG TPA: glycerate kinase [Actinomycetota bacterium]